MLCFGTRWINKRIKHGTWRGRSQGASSAIIVTEERDLDSFPWEQAARDLDFSKFYTVQKYLPENMKIVAMSGKIFTLTWMLMGFENFGINLAINPSFVERLFEKVADIQYKALSEIVKIPNVAAVWAVDDLAFKTGPMISPKMFRQYVFPCTKVRRDLPRKQPLLFLSLRWHRVAVD